MAHKHRANPALRAERGYSGPVSRQEHPAAHGNITVVDACNCGALRLTNVNQRHTERGPWLDDDMGDEE